jgi:hypothetical protein
MLYYGLGLGESGNGIVAEIPCPACNRSLAGAHVDKMHLLLLAEQAVDSIKRGTMQGVLLTVSVTVLVQPRC